MDTIRECATAEARPTTTPVASDHRTAPTPLDEAAHWLQEAADAHPGLVLPPAAARALELVGESTFNPAAVAHALQADPALAVPALQKANGLLFTCRGDSRATALRRLGARGSRDMVLTVAALGLSSDAVAAVPTAVFGTLRRHGVVQDRRYDGGEHVGDRERRLLRYLGSA